MVIRNAATWVEGLLPAGWRVWEPELAWGESQGLELKLRPARLRVLEQRREPER